MNSHNNRQSVKEFINEHSDSFSQILYTRNEYGLTLMQEAAKDGYTDIILWALAANVDVDKIIAINHKNAFVSEQMRKTPLYFAIENFHVIAAKMLIPFSSKVAVKNLALELKQLDIANAVASLEINPNIISYMLHWAVTHYHPTSGLNLLLRLKPFLLDENGKVKAIFEKDIQGLIELSACLDNMPMTLLLLEIQPQPRHDADIRTAGYWAVQNKNDKLLFKVCPDSKDTVVSLWQLQHENRMDEFTHLYNKITPDLQNEYKLKFYKNIILSSLSSDYKPVYEVALKNNLEELKYIPIETHYKVAAHALLEKNHVLLNILNQLKERTVNLITHALRRDFPELANFMMIANNLTSYDLCEQWFLQREGFKKNINRFVAKSIGPKAILSQLMPDSFNSNWHDIFLALPKTDALVFDMLIHFLRLQNSDPGLKEIAESSHDFSLQKRLSQASLTQATQERLDALFIRYNLAVRCKNSVESQVGLTNLPVLKHIFEFVAGNNMRCLNAEFYVLSSKNSPFYNEDYIKKQIRKIELHININNAIQRLDAGRRDFLIQFKKELFAPTFLLCPRPIGPSVLFLSCSVLFFTGLASSFYLDYQKHESLSYLMKCFNISLKYINPLNLISMISSATVASRDIPAIDVLGDYKTVSQLPLYLSSKSVLDKLRAVELFAHTKLKQSNSRCVADRAANKGIRQITGSLDKRDKLFTQLSLKKGIYSKYLNRTFFANAVAEEKKETIEAAPKRKTPCDSLSKMCVIL